MSNESADVLNNHIENPKILQDTWHRNLKKAVGRAGERTLELGGLPPDTTLPDLSQLFLQQGFEVLYVELHNIMPFNPKLITAHIGLRANEALGAQEWADGRTWRSKKLSASLLDR